MMKGRTMRYLDRRVQIVAAVLLPAPSSACSGASADARSTPAHELVVTARDFSFSAPQSVPAGLTRVRLRNQGS
jgi:hypothetical protein